MSECKAEVEKWKSGEVLSKFFMKGLIDLVHMKSKRQEVVEIVIKLL